VSVSPAAHAAAEAVWRAHRQHLLDTLGRERLVTPSGLAHEPEPEPVDPVISSASGTEDQSPRARRNRKAATNLGIAVHAVLQWLDLETQSNLPTLVAWFAAENGVNPTEVARLVQSAVHSAPIQKALGSGRYWREVPLSVSIGGVLLEGAIDLLYTDADDSLIVVDYKTDHVSPTALVERAEQYRIQGEAYALALRDGLGLHVSRIEFIFVAAGRDRAEVFTVEVGTLQEVAAAIARSD
jgi:ATP-dependent exoDNAse (exonuclease V) beta subunit